MPRVRSRRSRGSCLIAALAAAYLGGPSALAQSTETATVAVEDPGAAPVTLEIRDGRVRDVLQHIAGVGGIMIAITEGGDERVDLTLRGVPARQALQLVLEQANLRAEIRGDVLVVARPPSESADSAPDVETGEPGGQDGQEDPKAAFAEPEDDLRSVLAGKDTTGTPKGPPPESDGPSAEVSASGEERPVPDYDGRDSARPTAGEILIWVPRVAFYPVHLVFEYLIRVPIVWTITRLEEYYIIERVQRLLSFRDGKSIIAPTFLGDFGLRPAVGITNSNDDLFFRGNNLTLGVTYGGNDFFTAQATNTTEFLDDDSGRLRLFGGFVMRPDQPFYGQGPFTTTDGRYNYRIRRAEGGWDFRAIVEDLSWVSFGQTFRDVQFTDDAINDTVGQLAPAAANCAEGGFRSRAQAQPLAPCGYTDGGGYQLLENRITAKIDTRDPDTEFRGGSGALLELFGSFEFDPTNLGRNFLRFGGEAAGFYDFTDAGHTLALRLYMEFTERTGSSDLPIPFTELPALGGMETMRGFLPRRFVGDSAFMGSLSYRYPVWSLLDAEVFASVGNTFDGYLEGFSFERLHLNTGIGLRTSFTRDSSLQLLFALGTTRFEASETDDFEFDSVRIAFGYVVGF